LFNDKHFYKIKTVTKANRRVTTSYNMHIFKYVSFTAYQSVLQLLLTVKTINSFSYVTKKSKKIIFWCGNFYFTHLSTRQNWH